MLNSNKLFNVWGRMITFNRQQTCMKKLVLIGLLPLFLLSCKGRKKVLQDEDIVTVTDFIEFFPDVPLPIRVADTTLIRKSTDSSLIGYKIFVQFIPDSVLTREFGKGAKPRLYPIGKAREKGKETYLFIKAVNGNKRVGYLACFDKDNHFLQAMPLVQTDQDPGTSTYGSLDSKFQITTYREKKQGNESRFKRNVYIFNNTTNQFMLIMTEPNEEMIEKVINPIDTLPRKHKFAGDYVKDSKNFISFRDGKRAGELVFFVHFEKDNGTCKGELKGSAILGQKNVARFTDSGNPCALEFSFEGNLVAMKETGGCGKYRDIKCFFEGSFRKKAEPRPKKK